jgi:DNA-binding LytR/AlgR family response regulator
MKCIIIDSDKKSRTSLEKMLKGSGQIDKVFSCSNAQQALDVAMENEVDLAIVHFEEPGSNGLGFLADLPYQKPHLLVVSDKIAVAKDAYDHEALDFLLKPVKEDRLMKALARVISIDDKQQSKIRNFENLFLKLDGTMVKVSATDICVIEADSNYVKVYTTKKTYIIYSNLKRVMQNLSTKDFVRIHRSYIVRIDQIESIEDNLVKVGGQSVPVSTGYKTALMNRLKIL